jgi:hypothetical protein
MSDGQNQKKSGHTPGPWVWCNNRYGERRLFGLDNTPVLGVDDQCSVTKREAHVEPWSEEDERLIAAAPELGEALTAFVGWYRTKQDGEGPQRLDEVFVAARAALRAAGVEASDE